MINEGVNMSVEESRCLLHERSHQSLEAMRIGMERGAEEMQNLCTQVGQLITLVTEPAGVAEEVFVGQRGFELKGQRLAEYKRLQAAAKGSSKNLLDKFGYIKQSWQNVCKERINVGGRRVWLQKAIAAKRKQQSNTSEWAKAVKQARQELHVSTAVVRKGTPIHTRALQIQRLRRTSQMSSQAASKQKRSTPESVCIHLNRAVRLATSLIVGQRLQKGHSGYFCADGVANNRLARNLTTAREHLEEGLACAAQLQKVLSAIPRTITKATGRGAKKRKRTKQTVSSSACSESRIRRQAAAKRGTQD